MRAETTQDVAIVLCGGGDPAAEFAQAKALCEACNKTYTVIVGNDQIEHFPGDVTHACTLHPDKLQLWIPRRSANGFNRPEKVWAHRNYETMVTHWTRDWAGSTGLFCVKVARENGYVHILLCGVPMTVEGEHFIRKQRWNAAHGFRRGWNAHMHELRPYVRSYSGWTQEELGAPTPEWLCETIVDQHVPRQTAGLRA